jgi:hypothetical protein
MGSHLLEDRNLIHAGMLSAIVNVIASLVMRQSSQIGIVASEQAQRIMAQVVQWSDRCHSFKLGGRG